MSPSERDSSATKGQQSPIEPLGLLQYRRIGSFANYLEQAVKVVPPDQLKVVVLEDFLEDPRRHYSEVCRFLGVDDDGRSEFPPVRESQAHVCPPLSRFLRHPPPLVPANRDPVAAAWLATEGGICFLFA